MFAMRKRRGGRHESSESFSSDDGRTEGPVPEKSKGSDNVPVALMEVNTKHVVGETSSSLFSFLSARERKQKKLQDKLPLTWSKDAGKVTKQSSCSSIVGERSIRRKNIKLSWKQDVTATSIARNSDFHKYLMKRLSHSHWMMEEVKGRLQKSHKAVTESLWLYRR